MLKLEEIKFGGCGLRILVPVQPSNRRTRAGKTTGPAGDLCRTIRAAEHHPFETAAIALRSSRSLASSGTALTGVLMSAAYPVHSSYVGEKQPPAAASQLAAASLQAEPLIVWSTGAIGMPRGPPLHRGDASFLHGRLERSRPIGRWRAVNEIRIECRTKSSARSAAPEVYLLH